MYAFLITLREGLEGVLIISIVLAYLVRTGHAGQARPVWLGALAALVVTGVVGAAVSFSTARLSWVAFHIFEAGALFLAAGVLTYVIFWMKRQARDIKAHLHTQVEAALQQGSPLALAGLSFVLLSREALETVLFLQAGLAMAVSPQTYWLGAAAGLALAVVLGCAAYGGATRLPLEAFFNVTSVILVIFAAGMIANGFKELHEIALVPPIIGNVWNTYAFLPDSETFGILLGTLFGYDATPSLIQVVAYFGYLGGILFLFRRTGTRLASRPPRDRMV